MSILRKIMKWINEPKKKGFPRYVENDEKIRHIQEKYTRDQHVTYHIGMRQL